METMKLIQKVRTHTHMLTSRKKKKKTEKKRKKKEKKKMKKKKKLKKKRKEIKKKRKIFFSHVGPK